LAPPNAGSLGNTTSDLSAIGPSHPVEEERAQPITVVSERRDILSQ
jgi:hypothetical protein